MKGALLVGGTLGGGYVGITPGPVKVGNPVRPPSVEVGDGPPVMDGRLVADVAEADEPVLEMDGGFDGDNDAESGGEEEGDAAV